MKIGLLGAGGMGTAHCRHYSNMEGVEVIFFDPDQGRSAELSSKFKATRMASTEKLMAEAEIVDICLPSDLHVEFALKAIAERKPVFIEKPIARTVEEAAPIVEAAEKAHVPVGVAHVVRYFPEFREGHRLVASGKIGTPAAARTRRGGLAPSKGAGNWFMDHTRSGGVLMDLAVHDFDWLRWTLGEVKHLFACSVGAKTMQGPDYALTTLTFESGAIAHVETTWMDPGGFRATFEVCGSEGMIEFDSRLTPTLRTSTSDGSRGEAPLAATDDPYYNELKAFLDAVKTGKEPPVTARDGIAAVAIAQAAIESAKTGRVVRPARV